MVALAVQSPAIQVPASVTGPAATAISVVAGLLQPDKVKEMNAMGQRPLAKRKSYQYLAAGALIGMLLSFPLAKTGPLRDARAFIDQSQPAAPAFAAADPVWDEDIQRDWWPRFIGPGGRSSLHATIDNLSQSVPAEQVPSALRVVIETASPTVFRSPQARDSWRQAMEVSGRDVGQAAALLHAHQSGAEVLMEPFEMVLPKDPEKVWRAAIDHPSLDDLPKPPRGLDMDAARAALEQAVITTGLAGIRVPVPYWEDPKHVWRLAKAIERADAQLSEITGWPSPVLGLGGRIILTIGAPGNSTILHTPQGLLDVRTDWTSLAHEWFHALDYAMAPELLALASPGASYIKQSSGVLRLGRQDTESYRKAFDRLISDVENPPLSPSDRLAVDLAARKAIRDSLNQGDVIYPRSMVQGLGDIDKAILIAPVGQAVPTDGSPWLHWRLQASRAQAEFDRPQGLLARFAPISEPAHYLQNKMEVMAFAFSGHVSARMGESVLAPSQDRSIQSSPSYRPMLLEAQALDAAWGSFFSQLRPWHEVDVEQRLGNRPAPVIKSIAP